jgi:hypothetical protein
MTTGPSMSHVAGGEHGAALVALLYLPVVVVALLMVVELAARAGFSPALRLRRAYLATRPALQLAALGMIISAVVHLALVPAHLAEEPVLGVLFALDGVALLVAVAWSVTRPIGGWRAASVLLLLGGVLAYVWYVATGRETADAVGLASKLVELASIALLVLPGMRARLAGQASTHLMRTEV